MILQLTKSQCFIIRQVASAVTYFSENSTAQQCIFCFRRLQLSVVHQLGERVVIQRFRYNKKPKGHRCCPSSRFLCLRYLRGAKNSFQFRLSLFLRFNRFYSVLLFFRPFSLKDIRSVCYIQGPDKERCMLSVINN